MCLAIPGRIIEIDDQHQLATVEVSSVRRKINVQLFSDDPLTIDDWVLIHVGFAMSKISAEQAEEQMKLLRMLGEGGEAMAELEGYAFEREEADGALRR